MTRSRTSQSRAKFCVGELVHHMLFDYRGVVVDVDMTFNGSDEWYEQMAPSRPPKDQPWYRVLVDGASHETYVAERNLEHDPEGTPIRHPDLDQYFGEFVRGRYELKGRQKN
jgi:heat shock protein HspQ